MDLYIDRETLPSDEHEAAKFIEGNVHQLISMTEDFRAALDLLLYLLELERADLEKFRGRMRWASLAGSQGAIIACGFWEVMQAINAMKATTIWTKADMAERGRGIKLFDGQFPQIASIRKSAAHPGELSATAGERAKHSVKGSFEAFGMAAVDGTDAFIHGAMHINGARMTYGSSFKGKLVSYELSEESAQVLESVAGSYLITFLPLEDEERRQAREERAKTDRELRRYQIDHPEWFSPPDQR